MTETTSQPAMSQEEMIAAIYEQSQKTMNYMKWQLYITLVLVVIPLLALAVALPMVMRSLSALGGVYGGGLLQ